MVTVSRFYVVTPLGMVLKWTHSDTAELAVASYVRLSPDNWETLLRRGYTVRELSLEEIKELP